MGVLSTYKYPIFLAQQFMQGLESGQTMAYVFVGHPDVWVDASNVSINDTNPPTLVNNVQNVEYDIWRDMMGAVLCTANNAQFVIPRVNWTSGIIYTQYDDLDPNLNTQIYYALDVSVLPYRVYKCLWNNGGVPSTIAPSVIGSALTPQTTSDGYIWQYMYTIDTENSQSFLSSMWMPVLSDPVLQANALQHAGQLPTIVPGIIENAGLGYNPLIPIITTIVGDGTGANVSANGVQIIGGQISQVLLLNGGSGYTQVTDVNVYQSGVTTQASIRIIIPPYPNHGYNPLTELNAGALMLTVELVDDESGQLTVSNSYRRIGLLINPLDVTGNVATLPFYSQTTDITFDANNGVFFPGDVITDITQNTMPTATVVDVVTVNGAFIVRVVDVDIASGAFQPGDIIKNFVTTIEATVVSSTGVNLQPYTGDVVWVNQRTPVARSNSQIETLKLVFPFK